MLPNGEYPNSALYVRSVSPDQWLWLSESLHLLSLVSLKYQQWSVMFQANSAIFLEYNVPIWELYPWYLISMSSHRQACSQSWGQTFWYSLLSQDFIRLGRSSQSWAADCLNSGMRQLNWTCCTLGMSFLPRGISLVFQICFRCEVKFLSFHPLSWNFYKFTTVYRMLCPTLTFFRAMQFSASAHETQPIGCLSVSFLFAASALP